MRLVKGRKKRGIHYIQRSAVLDGIFLEGLKGGILKKLKREGIIDILRLDVKIEADVVYVRSPVKMLSKKKRHELMLKRQSGLFKPFKFNKDGQIGCARCGKLLYPEEMQNAFHAPLCAECAHDRARHAIRFEDCL